MSAPKLCKDCKWYVGDWASPRYAKCDFPAVRSLTDGVARRFTIHARQQGECGPEARWFEPLGLAADPKRNHPWDAGVVQAASR